VELQDKRTTVATPRTVDMPSEASAPDLTMPELNFFMTTVDNGGRTQAGLRPPIHRRWHKQKRPLRKGAVGPTVLRRRRGYTRTIADQQEHVIPYMASSRMLDKLNA
jgi:hypothetical protein